MSDSDKLEDCKKEIRSILIPYQRGCVLSEFNRAYKDLIGRRLPIREFGFNADIEFLYSIPDVVKITPTRTGEYHLQAIADEKSKHIQKMVAKQKPPKSRPSARIYKPTRSYNYTLPPRFSEPLLKHFEPISRQVRQLPEPQFHSRQNPKLSLKTEHKLPPFPVPKESKNLPKVSLVEEPKLSPKASPREEVIELVKYFDNQIALDDLLFEYQRTYQKDLLLSKYGFSSVRECIEEIPELDIVIINKCDFVVYRKGSVNIDENYNAEATSELSSVEYSIKMSSEVPSTFNSEYNSNQNGTTTVPDPLRKKLQMVAERFTEGIWSSDFSSCFEEATETVFDLHNIGYRSLSDLIDDVPDIFTRAPVAGSRKDFIIYSVNGSKLELDESTASNDCADLASKILIKHVVINLRKILQAYPEGIQIQEFLHIYSINCKDTLHIKDFGFDDLETFLSSLKNQVPLKLESSNGMKSIHLLYPSEGPVTETSPKEVIPFDAADPEFKFKIQTLSSDFDFSKYIPVYVSAVANPGHLYIQLQGERTTAALVRLSGKIETFYCGSRSALYTMKSCHVKVGATCIAQWPVDKHWYRAEIASIPSMEKVLVHYIDYGTRDIIPPSLLRYMKKEYTDLPAQAIRCRLAFLKPPNNATKWTIQAKNRILKLCEDVSLMVKVEETATDGVHSVVICDTNGEDDVYINDVLRNEGLAECDVENGSRDTSVPSDPAEPVEYHLNLNPLQALQAQYYLHVLITVVPSLAQNENYINLMRQVTMCCPNPSTEGQNVGIPHKTLLGPPGFNAVQTNMQASANLNVAPAYYPISSTSEANSDFKYDCNIPNSPIHIATSYAPAFTDSETVTIPKTVATASEENADNESEIFYDDDDELFQQFCQKVSTTKIRHVKRVLLDDEYKIHIIVDKSKPCASAGDISHLIWNNKDADYLSRRLQLKDVDIPSHILFEDDNKELFYQLERFGVKGIQKTTGYKTSILLYPLKVVIKILNLFGHPSVTLRTKLTEEIANFNPDDHEWMNFSSPEPSESGEEESLSGVTDDDKIEKLCIFDLLAMKESITMRRKKMMNSLGNDVKNDEFDKLEQLHQKVLQRIQEIKDICNVFS